MTKTFSKKTTEETLKIIAASAKKQALNKSSGSYPDKSPGFYRSMYHKADLHKKQESVIKPSLPKKADLTKNLDLGKSPKNKKSPSKRSSPDKERKEAPKRWLKTNKQTTKEILEGWKKRLDRQRPLQKLGILYLKRGRRNMFFTLCDSKNRIRASLSAGYLKYKGVKVKSKARKAMYNIKKLIHMLVAIILKAKVTKLYLKFKTSFPRRVKKTFFIMLYYRQDKFKICKLSRYRCKPHNGCRPRKIRRK